MLTIQRHEKVVTFLKKSSIYYTAFSWINHRCLKARFRNTSYTNSYFSISHFLSSLFIKQSWNESNCKIYKTQRSWKHLKPAVQDLYNSVSQMVSSGFFGLWFCSNILYIFINRTCWKLFSDVVSVLMLLEIYVAFEFIVTILTISSITKNYCILSNSSSWNQLGVPSGMFSLLFSCARIRKAWQTF